MAAHAGAREKSKERANDGGGRDRPCNTRRGAERRDEASFARGGTIRPRAQEFTSCTVFAHFALAFKGGVW